MSEETAAATPFPLAYRLPLETIAFWFWFVAAAKPFLVFLFFQDRAVLGTAAGGLLSFFFLLLVVPHAITHGHPRTAFVWPAAGKWLAAYLLWAVCTLLWTRAESRFVAAAYAGVLVSDVVLTGLLMRLGSPPQVAMASLRGLVLGTATLAAAVLGLAGTTVDSRLGDSEFLHPNVIGKQMAVAGLGALLLVLRSRARLAGPLLWAGCCALLAVTLLLSLSKTAMAAFAAGLLCSLFVGRVGRLRKFLVATLLLMTVSLTIGRVTGYLEEYLYVTQGGRALETASGRVLIWEQAWEMVRANPLLGYGIMAFRDAGPQIASVRLVTAHNEWLHQWFSYGVVGLVLCAALYASFFRLLLRTRKDPTADLERGMGYGLLAFALVRGLFEAEVTGLIFPLPLMLLMTLWLANLHPSGRPE